MARLHLEFPGNPFFYATSLTVRVTDVNAANHLANDSMISMISEARARMLYEYGVSEEGIIVTDLATVYRAEAHARDRLLFEVGLMDLNTYGGDIIFRITRPANGTLVALAKSGFVFFDYRAGKVAPMPADFISRFPEINVLMAAMSAKP